VPSALLRPCSAPLCPELVEGRFCVEHARQAEQRRGSSAARGYDARWRAFAVRFRRMLVAADVATVCGASLPGGPVMQDSRCKAEGRLNGPRLQVHHEPPLTDDERQDPRKVCDPYRVGLLCHSCHSARTVQGQAAMR
jgi:hypothetical protein